MIPFKPQKGKALDKLPKSVLDAFADTRYLVSTKYDGNQIWIVKHGPNVRLFTSEWKEFTILPIVERLREFDESFIVKGEFLHGCAGVLGDRVKSAILTTYRTNFKKGLANKPSDEMKAVIKVFDFLLIVNEVPETNVPYLSRLLNASKAGIYDAYLHEIGMVQLSGSEAIELADSLCSKGWEGVMLASPTEPYRVGKRVNYVVKIKRRPTADLECVGVEPGTGKYDGMVGSLILKDKSGRVVKVGSGLVDSIRLLEPEYFVGRVVEIDYEQILGTYIQPTFVRIRDDKTGGD